VLDVTLVVDRPRFVVEARFCLAPGERLGLYGPSGSGKSTILDALAGLVPIRSGRVLLDGRDLSHVPLWQRQVGLVRQRPGLFPHLTVLDNIRYGDRQRRGDARARADETALCERLGIGSVLGAFPGDLSGGQAQRVALARALRASSAVLLLDEPFQGLDPPLRRELVHLVREEAEARSLPVVLVAHELGDVQAFAERIGVLEEGRLVQLGGAGEVVRRPATARVAVLVGYVAVVRPEPGASLVGVHPDLARFGAFPAAGPVLKGTLRAVRPLGLALSAEVDLDGVMVELRCERAPGPLGTRVEVTLVDPPRFDDEGVLVDKDGHLARAPRDLAEVEPVSMESGL